MPARVFATLLCSEAGSFTAAELAELLRASPAAISGAVRYLSTIAMVSREGEPGSRRHHYRIPDDVWGQLVVLEARQMDRWHRTLREGIEIAGPASRAGQRMAESADYMEFLQDEMLALAQRWREYRARRSATDSAGIG